MHPIHPSGIDIELRTVHFHLHAVNLHDKRLSRIFCHLEISLTLQTNPTLPLNKFHGITNLGSCIHPHFCSVRQHQGVLSSLRCDQPILNLHFPVFLQGIHVHQSLIARAHTHSVLLSQQHTRSIQRHHLTVIQHQCRLSRPMHDLSDPVILRVNSGLLFQKEEQNYRQR